MSKEIYDQLADKPELCAVDIDLFSASGTLLSSVGKSDLFITLNNCVFKHTVVVIENFSYDFILGKDFLVAHKATIDFGNSLLCLPDVVVEFTSPKRKFIVSTVSDVCISAKTTVAVQTKLPEFNENSDLFVEGGFSEDNQLFIARILTKVRPHSNKITVQVTNLSDRSVYLPKCTDIAEVTPFVEQRDSCAEDTHVAAVFTDRDASSDILSEDDLKIAHLKREQRRRLVELLRELQITKDPTLGQVEIVKHNINVGDATPIKQQPYRVPLAKKCLIDEEVEKLLVKEIIRPSISPWSSPIVLVSKPDGSIRFCIDYRKVNSVTKKDAYPLPRIDETLHALGGATYFTTLDLQSGYWQVALDEKSKEITAFSTTRGHWEFNVMPFGLTNAPATFQRLMDFVLTGLHWSHCLVYLDDVIIFGKTFDEHQERLRIVLNRLCEAGLTLKPSKCQWARTEVKYLGHLISREGIKPDPGKITAVKNFPIPRNRTEVRAFLGLASYYRRFIQDFATIAKPLTELTKTKGNSLFSWTQEADIAFAKLKNLLIQAPILGCPDYKSPFIVQTDASNHGIGVVLAQNQKGKEVVIAYASRQLRPSEIKYAAIQKECLAIVWGIKHFHYYLYGQPNFTVITDHCPLQWIKRMQPKNQMIQRWICELQGYSFTVSHRAGKSNGNADALSRCPISSNLDELESCSKSWDVAILDAVDISDQQDSDLSIREMKDFLANEKLPKDLDSRKKVEYFSDNYFLEDDVLYHRWTPKVYGNNCRTRKQLVVPLKERGKILVHCHDEQGHPGFMRTYSKIRENYFWITMKKDIVRHCKNCKGCVKRKSPQNRTRIPLNPIESNAPLEIVGIDFVGPLPLTEDGNRYIMTFQDHFTRWPAAFPLKKATEIEVVDCIRSFSRDFGYPDKILSDRGSAFLSDIVKRACKQLKIRHDKTSAYNPQANGLCERFHDTLKTSLSLVINEGKNDWDSFVPDIIAAYRTTPHSVTKETPCFLMFGRQFRVSPSVEFQPPTRLYTEDFVSERNNSLRQAYAIVRDLNRKERERHKVAYDKRYNAQSTEFSIGDSVYLKAGERKTGLDRNHWFGPYRIIELISNENVKLNMPDSNRHPVVNINRLKKDNADDPAEICKSIRTVLDKMRTRNEKGRLETKYFVELQNGETTWIADDFVSAELLKDFKR